MTSVYDSIMSGLKEAVKDATGEEKKLKRRIVTVVPVKNYSAKEIQNIRRNTGMSQKMFAGYIGVSGKTVEAWEAGINHPSGAASRILTMMEMNPDLTKDFPFVKTVQER